MHLFIWYVCEFYCKYLNYLSTPSFFVVFCYSWVLTLNFCFIWNIFFLLQQTLVFLYIHFYWPLSLYESQYKYIDIFIKFVCLSLCLCVYVCISVCVRFVWQMHFHCIFLSSAAKFYKQKKTAFTALSMFYFRHLFILSVFCSLFSQYCNDFCFWGYLSFISRGLSLQNANLFIFFLVWWLHFLLIRQWFYDISFRFWVYNYILPLEYSSLTIHIHTSTYDI